MATLDECEAALHALAERLNSADPGEHGKHLVDRTLACTVSDLSVTFLGELRDRGLYDIRLKTPDDAPAQVRLRASSDDLLALIEGRLHFAAAWLTGKVKVDASLGDIMRLRSIA
jgi:predicted lipid carrier protein YhbT